MSEQKHIYRVKPGYTHGAFNQHRAGDTVELTTQEAAGFLDKLALVGVSQSVFVVTGDGGLVMAATTPNGNAETAQVNDTPPEPFDVTGATVDEVVAAVGEGKVTASEALIAEQQGKKRATLIEALTKLVEAEQK